MKSKILLMFCAVLATGAFGCASTKTASDSQIDGLRAALDETNARLDEINNKFLLLYEKMETKGQASFEEAPVIPPQGLKVVTLGEDGSLPIAGKTATASTPEDQYNRAQDFFLSGRSTEARRAFQEFIKAYPSHGLADNAQYWIGESYYAARDFEKAVQKFKELVERYPQGNKAPDALLKIAFSYNELKNNEKAKEYLDALLKKHPDTGAAEKAKEALKKF